jgi:ABC-type sugar transport system substrate-binding protein
LRYVTRNVRRDAQSLERGYQKEMRMLIRSLTLATLLAIAGPLFAADGDSPLDMDKGRARPLIVIAPSTVDPTWVSLKKSLDEPANRKGFTDRNMVLYTVLNLMGQRDGKDLGPQDTAALIRSLKLGAGAKTKVILVGKDGEKKLEQSDAIKLEEIFSAVDQLPAAEKEFTATVAAPVAEAEPAAKGAKAGKNSKPGKPAKPPEMPDD